MQLALAAVHILIGIYYVAEFMFHAHMLKIVGILYIFMGLSYIVYAMTHTKMDAIEILLLLMGFTYLALGLLLAYG
jgi:hypothetical protein